jgi:alanyl-tRNA synthetase
VILVAAFGKDVIAAKQQAGKFIGAIAKLCGGGGGGRPNLAQAGGRDGAALPSALQAALSELEGQLKAV